MLIFLIFRHRVAIYYGITLFCLQAIGGNSTAALSKYIFGVCHIARIFCNFAVKIQLICKKIITFCSAP